LSSHTGLTIPRNGTKASSKFEWLTFSNHICLGTVNLSKFVGFVLYAFLPDSAELWCTNNCYYNVLLYHWLSDRWFWCQGNYEKFRPSLEDAQM